VGEDAGGPEDETRLAVRGALSVDLQGLSASSRRIWEDPAERRRIVGAILVADPAGDIERLSAAMGEVDAAVTEALNLLGLPRGPIRRLTPAWVHHFAGRKTPDCDLQISLTSMRSIAALERGPDSILRTWVHESIHGRQPYADTHLTEYRTWSGYEEGLAEGLARLVVRGHAGLDPLEPAYNYHVAVYETLAEATGIEYESLLRTLWRQPAGGVREALLNAVDSGRRTQGLRSLTGNRRSQLAELADLLFRSANSARNPTPQVMLTLWRSRLR
jgi:hypothetical protein